MQNTLYYSDSLLILRQYIPTESVDLANAAVMVNVISTHWSSIDIVVVYTSYL